MKPELLALLTPVERQDWDHGETCRIEACLRLREVLISLAETRQQLSLVAVAQVNTEAELAEVRDESEKRLEIIKGLFELLEDEEL